MRIISPPALGIKESHDEIVRMGERVTDMLAGQVSADVVNRAVKLDQADALSRARAYGDGITRLMKDARSRPLQRMMEERTTPLASLVFMNMVNSYRRVKDHCLNIAEAVAGEK